MKRNDSSSWYIFQGSQIRPAGIVAHIGIGEVFPRTICHFSKFLSAKDSLKILFLKNGVLFLL